MPELNLLLSDLNKLANPAQAKALSWFFKTGKGEYGEGDIFLDIKVPEQRRISKKYSGLPIRGIKKLLSSKIHEHRLVALLILVNKYEKADDRGKKEIVRFYLKNTGRINNWDLVDLSAGRIIGEYLVDKDRLILHRFAKSRNLWERRIAIIATSAFIKNNEFEDTLRISARLINDKHDLIHKAVGWMLREIGKRDLKAEEKFLGKYYKCMPRTMLRYSIEKFDEKKRKAWLEKK